MKNETRLRNIFERTDGNCHLTGQRLAFRNYGKVGERGAWEIEHSLARANGGTDHLNNLYPAKISANRSKQDLHTRTVRARHGLTRAPLSKEAKECACNNNQWTGLLVGALIGLPFGAVAVGVLATLGAFIGGEQQVK